MKRGTRSWAAIVAAVFLVSSAFSFASGAKEKKAGWKVVKEIPLTEEHMISGMFMGFADAEHGMFPANGHLYVTSNGGSSWELASLEAVPVSCIQGMEILDAQTVFLDCTCSPGVISRDGGRRWTRVAFSNSEMISLTDVDTGWMGSPFRLNRLEGAEVTQVTVPAKFKDLAAISAVSAAQAFILNAKGTIAVTTDGGASWNQIDITLDPDAYALFPKGCAMRFSDANHGMILAYNRDEQAWKVFSTSDGGKSWGSTSISKMESGGTCFISRDLSLIAVYAIAEKKILLIEKG